MTLTAFASSVVGAPAASVTVDVGQSAQTVRGWSGTVGFAQARCAEPVAAQVVLNLVDLGVNAVRLELPAGSEHPVDAFALYQAGQLTAAQLEAALSEIVNDDDDTNHALPAGFHFSLLDYEVDTLVEPLRDALAARGERLTVVLAYTDRGVSTFEHFSDGNEYAELVHAAFLHLAETRGWVPDAVEIVAESDLAVGWTEARLAEALLATRARLEGAGFQVDLVAPSGSSPATAALAYGTLVQSPGVAAAIDLVGYRRTAATTTADLGDLAALEVGVAMLGQGGADQHVLFEDLTIVDAAAWEQAGLVTCDITDKGDGYLLVASAGGVTTASRAKFLKRVFAAVRQGAVRLQALSDNSPLVEAVAFRNPDGHHVVIVKTRGSVGISVHGLPAGTWGVTTTTDQAHDVVAPDAVVSTGGPAQLSASGATVFTLIEKTAPAAAGTLRLDPTVQVVSEGDGSVTFTVRRDAGTAGAVSADWATVDGTALAPSSYLSASSGVSFADGDAAPQTVTVELVDDDQLGTDRFFSVELSNASGGALLDRGARALVIVRDNDVDPNQAPVVDAGADQVAIGASAQLDATVSDDGLPSGTLTLTWRAVTGPTAPTFSDEHAEDPLVTLPSIGVYELELTADDGELTASDRVLIEVRATSEPDAEADVAEPADTRADAGAVDTSLADTARSDTLADAVEADVAGLPDEGATRGGEGCGCRVRSAPAPWRSWLSWLGLAGLAVCPRRARRRATSTRGRRP